MLVFNPDNLKEKKIKYEKKDKWISKIIVVCFFLCEVVFIMMTSQKLTSNIGICVVIVGALVVGLMTLVFLPLLISDRITAPFSNELTEVVQRYEESENAQKFYEDLLNIKNKPKTMGAEVIWYFNISTALSKQGKEEEALKLLAQLDEVAEKKEKELIKIQREDIQCK